MSSAVDQLNRMSLCCFSRQPPHAYVVSRLRDRMGEWLSGYLVHDPTQIVVTGSTVLDAIYGTQHAEAIDVFCTRQVAKRMLLDGIAKNRRVDISVLDEYWTKPVSRFRICGFPVVNVVVCVSPLSKVSKFDMLHSMVAFDGTIMYKSHAWQFEKITRTSIDQSTIDRISHDLRRLVETLPLPHLLNAGLRLRDIMHRMFSRCEGVYSLEGEPSIQKHIRTSYDPHFLLHIGRIVKYMSRGYTVYQYKNRDEDEDVPVGLSTDTIEIFKCISWGLVYYQKINKKKVESMFPESDNLPELSKLTIETSAE